MSKPEVRPFPIADLHCDTAMALAAGRSLDDPSLQVNLPALREGGIGLQVFACYLPTTVPSTRGLAFVERMIDAVRDEAEASGEISIGASAADFEAAQSRGRTAGVLAVENGNAIQGDLRNLERLRAMGVRLLTLIHSKSNEWIISSADASPAFRGLTDFGAEVVAAMNDLGIMIDLSHAHDEAVEKVLALSRKPAIASHSAARALCDVPRNLPDDLIRGIAAGGGLVGVNIFPYFLDPSFRDDVLVRCGDLFAELHKWESEAGEDAVRHFESLREYSALFQNRMADHAVSLERYLDHILHIIGVAGDSAVAFGSDFDGVPSLPEGARDCRVFSLVREGLRRRGLPPESLDKVCWGNVLRVFRAVCG